MNLVAQVPFFFISIFLIFLPLSKAVLPIAAVGLVIWYGFYAHQNKQKFFNLPTPINLALLTYLVWVLLNSIFSTHLGLSFKAFPSKILLPILMAVSIGALIPNRNTLLFFFITIIYSSGFIALSGFWQHITLMDFIKHTPMNDGRICATFRHANDYGAYLLVVILMLLSLLLNFKALRLLKSWMRIALTIVFILNVYCLVFTFSRNTWLGVILGIFVLLMLKRAWKFLLITVLTLVIGGIFSFSHLKGVQLSQKSFKGEELGRAFLGLNGREEYWDDALCMISQSASRESMSRAFPHGEKVFDWLTVQKEWQWTSLTHGRMGKITGTFREALKKRYPNEYHQTLAVLDLCLRGRTWVGQGLNTYTQEITKINQHGGYAHNCFLQMAAELGILGLALFLGLWGAWFFLLAKVLNNNQDPLLQAFGFGIFTSAIGLLWHSFFDTTMYATQLSYLMWFVFGMGLMVINTFKRLTLK